MMNESVRKLKLVFDVVDSLPYGEFTTEMVYDRLRGLKDCPTKQAITLILRRLGSGVKELGVKYDYNPETFANIYYRAWQKVAI